MREKKYHVYVNNQERRIILHSLVELINELVHQGRYGNCVDELIFKTMNAPVKKSRIG